MARKQKKYHYIYKTTNLVNGKYYIGMHSTNNLNDGYVGSGKRLWYSIKKYGRENFKCEILEMFQDRDTLRDREKELVNEDILKDKMCMNLKTGGDGGFVNEEHKQKFLKAGTMALDRTKKSAESLRKKLKDTKYKTEYSSKIKDGQKKINYNHKTFKNKNHSKETKQLMSQVKKNTGVGKNNSQFGTCWITNEIESKKIYKGDPIPKGWRLGRKIK